MLKRIRGGLPVTRITVVTLLAIVCGGCNLTDPSGATPADVVSIHVDSLTLSADGVSRTHVLASLSESTPDNTDVTFRVTAGQFIGADGSLGKSVVIKSGARQAVATYIADTRAGAVTLTAAVGNVVVDATISLIAAAPSEILLVPTRTSAKANGTDAVDLKASLFIADPQRIVSRGTRVDFVAVDSASGIEVSEMRGAVVLEGDRTVQVTHTITSRTSRTVYVTASVTSSAVGGSKTIKSNQVTLSFVP
jgi:hypothetical protein